MLPTATTYVCVIYFQNFITQKCLNKNLIPHTSSPHHHNSVTKMAASKSADGKCVLIVTKEKLSPLLLETLDLAGLKYTEKYFKVSRL